MRPKRAELGPATLYRGDCRDVLKSLPTASVDSVVCDPPYELGFMGRAWDASGIAYDVAMWREVLRVLKPGGHLLAFGGTRTYHRMTVAIEDAGFEIRDCIQWLYGSGFPKSLDVSKAIDKAAGAERPIIRRRRDGVGNTAASLHKTTEGFAASRDSEFNVTGPATAAAAAAAGWGTALKPANEPIVVARKPLIGTVAENVTTHGTGALNIDASRIPFVSENDKAAAAAAAAAQRSCHDQNANRNAYGSFDNGEASLGPYLAKMDGGRWPANVIHDGSDEVLESFAAFGETRSGAMRRNVGAYEGKSITPFLRGNSGPGNQHGDTGTAARFFYCAKASRAEREGNKHPTVKPLALARYLVRLVTPPGGTMLTPFMGSGTEVVGAVAEGFEAIGIERDADSFATSKRRVRKAVAAQQPVRQRVAA